MKLNKKSFLKSLYKVSTVLFLVGYNFAQPFLAIRQLLDIGGEITPVAAADGPYTISSTSGIWTKVEGTTNYSGLNTSEIRWGTGSKRSGLKFNKAGAQTFDADQKFLIGDLTHMNWPVSGGTADSATLKVTLNFSQPPLSPNPTFSYKFNINETSNSYYNYWNCPGYAIGEQLSETPCDDVITFPSAYGQEVFTIGDMKYTLKIDGFQSQYPTGNPVSKFITEERKDNVAYLVGHLSSILMERPAISIVKKVNGQDANTPGEAVEVTAGETVNFTYIVQNTGNVKLTNIAVTDDKGVQVTCPGTELEPGTNMTCTGSATAIAGNYTNIGTVTSSHNLTASDPANYKGIIPTIKICHSTASHKSPYEVIEPDASGDLNGHAGHDGPIWTPGITVEWGDIIPPFTSYDGVPFTGLNWSEYGQAVYNNNCVIPQGKIIVKKALNPASNDNTEFTITGSGTSSIDGSPTFLYNSNSNIGSISRNQSHTYNVMPGTYNIEETVPAGWSLVSNTCSNITITNNETKECTITNTQDGSLTIVKKALPFGTDSFGFTLTGGNGVNKQFNLVDNSATEDASETFSLKAGTYAVAENDYSSDWNTTHFCTDNNTIDNIVLGAGKSVTCTFTNTKYGSISGYKYEDADNSDETTTDRTPVSGWTIILKDKDGVEIDRTTTNASGYYEFTGLLPADYIVTEGLEVGWIVLVGASKNVTLDAGENEENVNFVNVKLGSIKVLKNVDKNGDEVVDQEGSTEWSWTLNGTNAGATGTTKSDLEPGMYTIKETGGLPNYHFVSLTCTGAASERIIITGDTAKIDLRSGEDVVCTYTNARNLGKLIIEKEVINDNGGSKKATNFSFQIGSEDPIQFTQNGENELLGRNEYVRYAGLSYTITEVEANQDGYTTTYSNCEDIVVPHNGQVVCKIKNNDNKPSLTLVKEVKNNNGGELLKTDWTLTATGPTTIFGDGGAISGDDFKAGTYTLSEVGKEGVDVSGYEAGKWSCTNNIAVNDDNQITLGLGQSTVCTIVNDDIAPSLQLVKEVNNNYGGKAKVTDWTLTATGPTTIFGDGGVTSGDNFAVGTYTLSEAGQSGVDTSGYQASDWSCTNNVVVNENNQITLGLGQTTKCTITNSDIQPKLKLVKTVSNNHGGKKEVADFNLYIGNTEVDSGVATGVNANTEYTVREDQLPGYTASDWSGDCSADGKITLLPGENKTCYITNSDSQSKITIIKKVINDNGGMATVNDFNITLTDSTLEFDAGVEEGDTTTYTASVFGDVNKEYTLSETVAGTGYTMDSLECSLGSDGVFTLPEGQNVTCTIVNNDIAPKLTLNKIISNTHGGNKVESNWTLYAKQGEVVKLEGQGAEGDNDVVSPSTFQAGSYSLSESGPAGYDASAWNCTGTGSLDGNVITLGVGQEAVCSITNSDRAAGLTVIKHVVNDNGGTATADDFDITLNGEELEFKPWTGGIGKYTFTYSSTPEVQSNTRYTLAEIDHPGYKEGKWSCVDNKTQRRVGSYQFTLAEGQSVTCTITNDDIAPSLQLVKVVNNNYGGEAKVTDWTLTATGPTTISGKGGVTSGNNFAAGTYTLSESGDVTGYDASSWSCTNGVTVDANNGITLGLGESTVCTITNSDIQPTLTVIKVVEKGTYGDKEVSDFTLYVGNTEVTSGTSNGFNAGNYIVSEDNVDGYERTITGDCDPDGKVTLNVGDNKTCTITNRSTHGKIIIKKLVEPNTDSTEFTFTEDVTGTIGHNGELEKIVVPGDYSVTETFKSGWNLKSLECDDTDSSASGYTANIKVGDNETVTCTFTNEKLGKISGYKYEDKNGNGVWDEGEPALKDWTINNGLGDSTTTNDDGYYEFINLPVGNTYTITETLQPGWTQTSTNPSAITIAAGDDIKDINFGNFKHVTINVTKNVVGIDEETDVEDDTTFTVQLNGGNEKLISETTTATYTIEQPGTYTVSEFDVVDYTYLGCFLGDAKFTDYAVESGKTYDIVCKNAQLPATIEVTKNVVNSDGVDEEVFSDDQFDVVLGNKTKQIADTANGKLPAIFEGLQPGNYTLTETQKDGYIFEGCTNSEGTLRSNETVEVVCTNRVIDPLLEIEKSNDKQHIDQLAGNEVTYTITVTAPNDDETEGTYILNDVVVSDIAPAGFEYVSDSWIATSDVRGDIKGEIGVEPSYGTTPAIWNLGTMVEGETVTLTYRTRISLLQDPGNYPDIAWVKGVSVSNLPVYGNVSTGAATPFVGTDVTVIDPIETEEGEVLGASITLPVTGASTYLTLGALIMMILGAIALFFKPFKKLNYALLTGLMAISFVTLLTPNRVLAVNEDINVRIMQPATPTNKSSFNVGFVALDLQNRPVKVECYKEGEVAPFANFTANTGNCPVTVSTSGTYKFYVKATADSDTQTSDVVTVVVDLEKPAPVIDYSKAGNVIKFKTPNDPKIKTVEIHRSDKPSYTANESTRIHPMPVSPNTEYSWTDTSAKAGKTYYYALRTVDALGNVSSIVSDPEVVKVSTVSTPTTTTTTTTTTTGGEVAGQKDTADEGEVAGETDDVLDGDNQEIEKTEDGKEKTDGDVKETVEKAASKWYIWVIAIVVLGGVAYYVRKQKRN